MAEPSSMSKYVAETVGTFALVFAVGCNVMKPSAFGVISIASTLMVFIYALGGISGGHFNPAVTFAVALAKSDFGWSQAGIYMLCQVIGGFIGAAAYTGLFGDNFNLAPSTGFHWYDAMVVEFHYTFMLVFTVLNVALAARSAKNEYFGLAIAFTVVAGGYGGGRVSGGAFNPAVALSIDGLSAFKGFGHCGEYIVAELLGALFAYFMYRIVRPEEFGGDDNISMTSKLVSEFIGTYFLIYTIGMNVASNAAAPGTIIPPAAAVFSIAASLMCMIYALGNVSGGHFNPAVTVAILISGRNKIDGASAGMYMVAQLLGGMCAGLMFGATIDGVSIGQPNGTFGWGSVFGAEGFFTFVLCFVVLSVATVRASLAHFFALAIGFCVVVGGYSIGSVSGGHLNPAVSFGLDVSGAVYNKTTFYKCFVYWCFQIFGGAAAAGVFAVTHATEYAKGRLSQEDSYGSI